MDTTLSELIASADRGDRSAASSIFTLLYSELHRTAHRELARAGDYGRLSTTTLLHEAYLDIRAAMARGFPTARGSWPTRRG